MPDDRQAYLREWRQGLWYQIRQKEDAIWRFMTFYAAALVLAASLLPSGSTAGGALATPSNAAVVALAVFVVSFYGIVVVLDANFWLRRNLLFVGNIEREILEQEDIGTLVPRGYTQPLRFRYKGSYAMHGNLLFSVVLLTVAAFGWLLMSRGGVALPADVLSVGVVVVVYTLGFFSVVLTDRDRVREFFEARKGAPGPNPGRPYPRKVEVTRFTWSSYLSAWEWALALVGASVFLLAASLSNLWPVGAEWIRTWVVAALLIVALLGVLLQTGVKLFYLPSCGRLTRSVSLRHPGRDQDAVYSREVEELPCWKRLNLGRVIAAWLGAGVLTIICLVWIVAIIRIAGSQI